MVEVNFGVGYGPVSLNYEDVDSVEGFTLDWLVAKFAALPDDNDEWFPFYAYCRNAGHIVDDYEAARIWKLFDGAYIRYHTVPNWASPITFLEIAPDAPVDQLEIALSVIREFASGDALWNREESSGWREYVDAEIEDYIERDVGYDEEQHVGWYADWIIDNEAYVIDGGGLTVDVQAAREALEAATERHAEERESR